MADNITGPILGVIPALQSTALLSRNLRLLPAFKPGKMNSRRVAARPMRMKVPSSKMFVRQGVENLVGVSLIGATSKVINSI